MTEEIRPAFTPEKWHDLLGRIGDWDVDEIIKSYGLGGARIIAVANASLPDDDPQKFTREDVALLRDPHTDNCSMWWLSDYPGAQQCDCGGDTRLDALADRIAALLPPEEK